MREQARTERKERIAFCEFVITVFLALSGAERR
jgi:hypothetical protein